VPPLFTEPPYNLHPAKDIDDFQASRSPATNTGRPLCTGFADLNAVVAHSKGVLKFNLSPEQRRDLVEYLKSL
jgi:hypothetical protein